MARHEKLQSKSLQLLNLKEKGLFHIGKNFRQLLCTLQNTLHEEGFFKS